MSANKPDPSSKYRDVHAVSLPSLATQKRKRVKRKANAEQRDVFRGIELEADSGGRPSYMPYEKLYFPRITRESKADPQAELQNLFTVGQLHHEGECGPSGPHVAAVREYERRFHRGAKRKVNTQDEDSTYKQHLSKEEIDRLNELQNFFKKNKHNISLDDLTKNKEKYGANSANFVPARLKDRVASSALVKENKEICRALAAKGAKGKKIRREFGANRHMNIHSSKMQEQMELDRLEQKCAIIIQRSVRKYMRIAYWKRYLKMQKAATDIQKSFRMFRSKKWLQHYLKNRHGAAVKVQAYFRGVYSRKMFRELLIEREISALDIQRVFRGALFRRRLTRRKYVINATKIQAIWRGAKARAQADWMYFSQNATFIQKHVRRWLKRKLFLQEYWEQKRAASIIQTITRGYVARRRRNQVLWDRDLEERQRWTLRLQAQSQYYDKASRSFGIERAGKNYSAKIAEAKAAWSMMNDRLALAEYDLVNLENEKGNLSPRGLSQGWGRQLQVDSIQHRKIVTEIKSTALFEVALRLRSLEFDEKEDYQEFERLATTQNMFATQALDARQRLQKKKSEMAQASKKMTEAKTATSEKRKWQVEFYTSTGKPDLRRPSGAKWDMSRFPNKESKVYTIAHGNILDLCRPPQPPPEKVAREDRESQLKYLHFMNVMGPNDTLPVGEAEEYAPDKLPAPMTAEEVVAAISDGYLAPGVNSAIGRQYARLKKREEGIEDDKDTETHVPSDEELRGGYVDDTGKWISHATAYKSLRKGEKALNDQTQHNEGYRRKMQTKFMTLSQIVARRQELIKKDEQGREAGIDTSIDDTELDAITGNQRKTKQEKIEEQRQRLHDQNSKVRVDLEAAKKRVNRQRYAGTGTYEQQATVKTIISQANNNFETAEEMLERLQLDDVASDSTIEDDLERDEVGVRKSPEYLSSLLSHDHTGIEMNKFSSMLSEMKQQNHLHTMSKEALPPGYEAAIKGATSSKQAREAAGIYIGNTNVYSSAHDRLVRYQEEVKQFKNTGDRVQKLANRMGALSGQMELMQYGALLKPLFKNISKVAQRLGAGPEGPHDKVEGMKEQLEAQQREMRPDTANDSKASRTSMTKTPRVQTRNSRTPIADVPQRKSYVESGRLGAGRIEFTDDSGDYALEPEPTPRSPTLEEIRCRARKKEKEFAKATYIMDETDVYIRRQLDMPKPPKQPVVPPPYTLPDEQELRQALQEDSPDSNAVSPRNILRNCLKKTERRSGASRHINWTLFDEINDAKTQLSERIKRPQTWKEREEQKEKLHARREAEYQA